MKLIHEGKSKNIYILENGNYELLFKDRSSGNDGNLVSKSDAVGLPVKETGKSNLETSVMFFELLKQKGIETHYLSSDLERGAMEVIPAKPFGEGVEMICRYRAIGSFVKRYGKYTKNGNRLNAYVEAVLKDDSEDNPLITEGGLEALGIMNAEEYRKIETLTRKITAIVANILAYKGLELYEIKFEFGKDRDGKILLIDEISSGNMRVYQNGTYVDSIRLTKLLLE